MTQHWPDMAHGDDPAAIDAAAKWFAKIQCGLSRKERDALMSWLKAAPENVAAMDLVSQAWQQSAGIGGPVAFNTTAHRLDPRRRAFTPERRLPRRRLVAATLTGAIACGAFAAIAWIGTSIDETYRTRAGQVITLNLPDGSRFKLASATSLHVRMDPLHRSASLETGQAEFDVAHHNLRPFRVTTDDLVIRDIGTRFAVRNRAKAIQVVLIDGVVDIRDASKGQLVRLTPGEEATATPSGLQVKTADLDTALAWSEGRIVFQDISLKEALEEWRTQSGVEFQLSSPDLGLIKVSGTYRTTDVIAFLNGLSRVDSVRWREIAPNRFELRSASHGS